MLKSIIWDYSFQYDRRMLSLALQVLCKRQGIQLKTSTRANIVMPEDVEGQGDHFSILHNDNHAHLSVNDHHANNEYYVKSKVVVDASGSGSSTMIKRHYAHFNCNSVWTYYKAPKVICNDDVGKIQYPSYKTHHLPRRMDVAY